MTSFHEETPAERALRIELRRRKLCFRQGEIIAGREVDFFLPGCLLAVEVDGLFHLALETREQDRIKEHLLAGQGIELMRFSNREVLTRTRWCGDRIAGYARAWQGRVKRAAAAAGETPLQRGLRTWLAETGQDPGQRGKPSWKGRGRVADGR